MLNSTVHELKTLPEYFNAIRNGLKNFEVRKNDRDFKVGDFLVLKEWDGEHYTGREQIRKVKYILDNPDYVKEGYVIMSFGIFS